MMFTVMSYLTQASVGKVIFICTKMNGYLKYTDLLTAVLGCLHEVSLGSFNVFITSTKPSMCIPYLYRYLSSVYENLCCMRVCVEMKHARSLLKLNSFFLSSCKVISIFGA